MAGIKVNLSMINDANTAFGVDATRAFTDATTTLESDVDKMFNTNINPWMDALRIKWQNVIKPDMDAVSQFATKYATALDDEHTAYKTQVDNNTQAVQ